jgi:hypothetical protein
MDEFVRLDVVLPLRVIGYPVPEAFRKAKL